jgi:hypothetical protein
MKLPNIRLPPPTNKLYIVTQLSNAIFRFIKKGRYCHFAPLLKCSFEIPIMKLTSKNVTQLFKDCLYNEGENTDDHVKTEAIKMIVGFDPKRLKENKENILDLLKEFPDSFMKSGGGGMSFVNMCQDKNGIQWTDFHSTMDELVALGIASGQMSYVLPRNIWRHLPGGMPYLVIDL